MSPSPRIPKLLALSLLCMILLLGCGTDHAFERGERSPQGPVAPDMGNEVSFSLVVQPELADCVGCHASGAGGWTYVGGTSAHSEIFEVLDLSDPPASLLLRTASGQVSHVGGIHFPVGSDTYQAILNWIESGAPDN